MKQLKDNLKNDPEELKREMEKRRRNNPEPEIISAKNDSSDAIRHEAFENQDEKVKNFVAEREELESQADKAIELAAQKIISLVMNKNSIYSEDDIAKDLMDIIKNITTKDIIEKLLVHLDCPLILNPGWKNCGEQAKGACEFCHGGNFTRCPAFNRYVAFQIIATMQRKK